jgi:hypothetical protein
VIATDIGFLLAQRREAYRQPIWGSTLQVPEEVIGEKIFGMIIPGLILFRTFVTKKLARSAGTTEARDGLDVKSKGALSAPLREDFR